MEQKREVFILIKTKPFRHSLKLFLKDRDNKTEQRLIPFTTEHKVTEKERVTGARKKHAEYASSNKRVIEGLYRDTGYGIVFRHIDDPDLERKLESYDVTPLDAKKIAFKNLFKAAGLDFDGKKRIEVLEAEYQIYIGATSGKVIKEGIATHVPHTPVDVFQQLQDAYKAAHGVYEEKYGEPMPDIVANDKGFLSALSDPDFDAKAYIAEKLKPTPEEENEGGNTPDTLDDLRNAYFEKFNKNVANVKKNDAAWIKAELAKEA